MLNNFVVKTLYIKHKISELYVIISHEIIPSDG